MWCEWSCFCIDISSVQNEGKKVRSIVAEQDTDKICSPFLHLLAMDMSGPYRNSFSLASYTEHSFFIVESRIPECYTLL